MTRNRLSTGSPFEKQAGYSRAIVQGDWCFVSGTTGYDYNTMAMPTDVRQQTENTFTTIFRTLEQAGFAASDIVRVNYIVTNQVDCSTVMDVAGQQLASIRPAATMIVAGLIKPEMKVEIEVTALRENGS